MCRCQLELFHSPVDSFICHRIPLWKQARWCSLRVHPARYRLFWSDGIGHPGPPSLTLTPGKVHTTPHMPPAAATAVNTRLQLKAPHLTFDLMTRLAHRCHVLVAQCDIYDCTHADRQGMDISFTVFSVCLLVCFILFVWSRISPPRIKLAASNFAWRFIDVQGKESLIFVNFAPPEAQKARHHLHDVHNDYTLATEHMIARYVDVGSKTDVLVSVLCGVFTVHWHRTKRAALYLATHCNIGSKRAFFHRRTRQVTQLFTYLLTHKLFSSCLRRYLVSHACDWVMPVLSVVLFTYSF